MLRNKLTGFRRPVPFNVKSSNVTINFQTDDNNLDISKLGYGTYGWALSFTIIYPTAASVKNNQQQVVSNTTIFTPKDQLEIFGYTCTAECKWQLFELQNKSFFFQFIFN